MSAEGIQRVLPRSIGMTDQDYAAFEEAARRQGISVSKFVRTTCRDALAHPTLLATTQILVGAAFIALGLACISPLVAA